MKQANEIDFQKIKERNTQISILVTSLTIKTIAEYNKGAELRAIIKNRLKKLSEAKLMTSEPYRKKVLEINDLFKEQIDPLEEIIKKLDLLMLKFKKEEKALILSKIIEKKEDMPIEAPLTITKTSKGVTSLKELWKGRVIAKEAVFAKYPDMFEVNQSKLDEFARFMKVRGIFDGIEIYTEEILATRI